MKAKRVGKKDANTKTTHRCVIKEETEVLGIKPLRRPPSNNRSTRQSVGIHELARDPSSLIYLMYLAIQAPTPTRLLGIVSCLALRILQQGPCCICHPWLLPMLPSSTKFSLDTLKGYGKYFGLSTSQWYGNGEVGVEEIHKQICRDMWVLQSLTLKVCG